MKMTKPLFDLSNGLIIQEQTMFLQEQLEALNQINKTLQELIELQKSDNSKIVKSIASLRSEMKSLKKDSSSTNGGTDSKNKNSSKPLSLVPLLPVSRNITETLKITKIICLPAPPKVLETPKVILLPPPKQDLVLPKVIHLPAPKTIEISSAPSLSQEIPFTVKTKNSSLFNFILSAYFFVIIGSLIFINQDLVASIKSNFINIYNSLLEIYTLTYPQSEVIDIPSPQLAEESLPNFDESPRIQEELDKTQEFIMNIDENTSPFAEGSNWKDYLKSPYFFIPATILLSGILIYYNYDLITELLGPSSPDSGRPNLTKINTDAAVQADGFFTPISPINSPDSNDSGTTVTQSLFNHS